MILIIDKISSYINHFESTTVRKKNYEIKLFSELLRGAHKTVLLDADLMDIHLKYISDIVNEKNKNIILYNNRFKMEMTTPVTCYFSEKKMYKKILEIINKGELVYICSDRVSEINKLNVNLNKYITHRDFRDISYVYTKIDGDDNDF